MLSIAANAQAMSMSMEPEELIRKAWKNSTEEEEEPKSISLNLVKASMGAFIVSDHRSAMDCWLTTL